MKENVIAGARSICSEILHHSQQIEKPNPPAPLPTSLVLPYSWEMAPGRSLFFTEGGAGNLTPLP